jgi:NAD(P)-dependent dehydrogenase (short-subunit alcohol dehydrogenase family)
MAAAVSADRAYDPPDTRGCVMRFSNKVAFITGGAIGFGRAFGRALGAEGASIVIADIDESAAQSTAKEFEAEGFRALAVACDVANEEQVEASVSTAVAQLGGIAILINNAGKHLTKYSQPFTVLPRFELRALFEVNVIGAVNCSVACRPSMKARGGGVMLNISSIAGYLSSSPYGVSKLAVRGLTVALAQEFSPDNIRVNAIAPGLMATENAMIDLPQDLVDGFVNNLQLVKRLGQMDDIVKAMLFLCSDDGSFVTGETIKISGGYPLGL